MTQWNWNIDQEQYDEAIKWTIKEVIDALQDLKPTDLSEEQWVNMYYTLNNDTFDDAYLEYLRIEEESGCDDDYLTETF